MSNSSPIKLHIVSLDVPYPPDYGGMIDVFYTIQHLCKVGVHIYLHCFQYGRPQQELLEQYCEEVYYYPRVKGWKAISLHHPYMMYSRRSDALLENLTKVEAPILFEGVHTVYDIANEAIRGRKKAIRNQNVEQEYFQLLGKKETSLFRKFYYKLESHLLKRLEDRLHYADAFMTVSQHDHNFFKKKYPKKEHLYIPSFQPYDEVVSLVGKGDYIIYHGNLGHIENADAVQWLAQHVFPKLNHKIIVTGKNPSPELKYHLSKLPMLTLIANPDRETMEQLITNAQVHLLPTFQASGLKLKLLHALFCGRHVIVNAEMLHGTNLDPLCEQCDTADEMIIKVDELMNQSFTVSAKEARSKFLQKSYNNRINAERIKAWIVEHS